MKPLFFSAGFLTLLLSAQAASAQSASSSSTASALYDRIKEQMEDRLSTDQTEPEIATFVKDYFKTKDITLSTDDVTDAIQNQEWSFCGNLPANNPAKSQAGCAKLGDEIRALVIQEERVRDLGRDLQTTATSDELPLSDLPARSLQFSRDMQGVIGIWSANTPSPAFGASASSASSSSSYAPLNVRVKVVDPTDMRSELTQLGQALKALKKEEQTAAVWRYQYGVRFVTDDRNPPFPAPYEDTQSGPGTERQYLFKHWDTVEQALTAIWNKVKNDTFTPPLKSGEIVQYSFPANLLQDTLPDNVIVWARMDTDATINGTSTPHPFADVGLQWQIPLEPVLPSLVTTDDKPILGGNYPPDPEAPYNETLEPVDGRGLCSNPTAARGFLCRPFSSTTGETCPGAAADATAISLISCQVDTNTRTTLAGPDVCRDIDIRTDTTFDPNTQCKISITCKGSCAEVSGVDATVGTKDANGVISICVSANKTLRGMTPLVYHELMHAYQQCTFPPGYNPYDKTGKSPEQQTAICCELEGGGYRAQCDMAAEDGAFDGNKVYIDPTTNKPYIDPVTGTTLPINAETCAEALANVACAPDGYQQTQGCYQSRSYPKGFSQAVFDTINNNPKIDPKKCSDVLLDPAKMDPRIRDLIDAIQKRRDVCAPGQVEVYKNTIGNNMCYIGQCVEETTELSRTTGAQATGVVGDQASPWNDPLTGAPLGNALVNPPLTPSNMPLYRPQLVVEEMEKQLCQQAGLPPLTPSILCTYDPSRRLSLPLIDPISNAESFLVDNQAQKDAVEGTLSLSLAYGTRLGTEMYADYMRVASQSLADILAMAVKLFKEMSSIDFPTQMCPTDMSLPPPAVTPGS